jgi:hypothetical protein
MAYKITQEGKEYVVSEVETGQSMYKSNNRNDAKMVCRSLNLGSGFNGHTPDFFNQTYKKGDP